MNAPLPPEQRSGPEHKTVVEGKISALQGSPLPPLESKRIRRQRWLLTAGGPSQRWLGSRHVQGFVVVHRAPATPRVDSRATKVGGNNNEAGSSPFSSLTISSTASCPIRLWSEWIVVNGIGIAADNGTSL